MTIKLEKSEGGTAYYTATGPLTHRDIAVLRKHQWIPLMSGKCQMWWQGDGDGRFLFNNRGHGSDQRVLYDTADPEALAKLNAAWDEYRQSE